MVIDLPISYFSEKLDIRKIIPKLLKALLLFLKPFDVNESFTLVVFTDHNPLIFINKIENKNESLTRRGFMLQSDYQTISKANIMSVD